MLAIDHEILDIIRKKPSTIGEIMKLTGLGRKQVADKLKKLKKEGYNVDQVAYKDNGPHKNVAVYGLVREKITMGNLRAKPTPVKLPEKPLRWFDCLPIGV